MKKVFGLLMILMLLFSAAGSTGATETASLQRDVVILFTSDVHCGVNQGFTYAGLSAVRDALSEGNHVLLVDNGDSIQGDPMGLMTSGMAIIELMNAVGYDIAIPGNHEFDYGTDRFLELAGLAEFPYICCNLFKEDQRVFAPWILKAFDGVKIGFVGAVTPETITTSTVRFFQDQEGRFIYDFLQGDGTAFYAAIQQAVDEVRAEGAAYVILMGHLGNSAASHPYHYADVIEHTTGIDAVLDGHSHDTDRVVMKNQEGKPVIRQACGTKLSCIGWLRISAADGSVDTGLYTWDNSVTAPELFGIRNEMSAILDEKTGETENRLSEVVGYATTDLTISDPEARDEAGKPIRIVRRAETNLGDFCTDAIRAISGADVVLMDSGAIRVSIPRGPVTIRDLMTVWPFGNTLMMVEATGRQILDSLEWGVKSLPDESGAFLQVSGLTYQIDLSIESSCTCNEYGMFTGVDGEYRVRNVMIGNEALDPDRLYRLAGPSYMIADQENGNTALDGAVRLWESEKMDYEMLADYIRDALGGVIGEGYEDPYGDGRITAVE